MYVDYFCVGGFSVLHSGVLPTVKYVDTTVERELWAVPDSDSEYN